MNNSRLLAVSALTAGLLGAGACQLEDDEPSEQAEEPQAVGACVYENPFSKAEECKLYVGQTFTPETAATDCSSYVFGAPGAFTEGGTCEYPETLGTCIVEDGTAYEYALVFPGDDPSACASTRNGCEVFAKGRFEPSALCEGAGGGGGGGGSVFVQPYLECKDPLEAPEGQSADGQVCTWTLISASTEEGRRYQDYASCEDVLTQRPYYPSPPAATTPPNDARLADTEYLAEVAWAREQVEASACICCHSTGLAPNGPSQWFVEAEGIWLGGVVARVGVADDAHAGVDREHALEARAAASVPSATMTMPACSELPMPTPPPWWKLTHDAPPAQFASALRIAQSAIASEPSFMASVSRNGDATEPQSR
jgi:hypothetical protein